MALAGAVLGISSVALGVLLARLLSGRQQPAPEMDAHAQLIKLFGRRAPQPTKDVDTDLKATPPADCGRREVEAAAGRLALPLEGFSVEDAWEHNKQMQADFRELEPAEVLANLQRGNARFWTGKASRPERSAFQRRAMIMQQFPVTAVLGCSDSRVPVELVFDQGLGDMFVVRVAGNFLDTITTASLQYAVFHLQVKVLMVLGHEGCGAVKAAGLPREQIAKQPGDLARVLGTIKAGLDEDRLQHVHDARAFDREAAITNVRLQVARLSRNAAIMQKVREQKLILVGCFYEISSGIVDFIMEITGAPENSSQPEASDVQCEHPRPRAMLSPADGGRGRRGSAGGA